MRNSVICNDISSYFPLHLRADNFGFYKSREFYSLMEQSGFEHELLLNPLYFRDIGNVYRKDYIKPTLRVESVYFIARLVRLLAEF